MSLSLGKIHYWLFNKIVWFEKLESEIVEVAKTEGLNVEKINEEITERYGDKLPKKPLEEIIDTGNIHGWLQSKINTSEGRVAAWTFEIINNSNNGISKLGEVYRIQGINAANEVKEKNSNVNSAEELYNLMNDYVLDGMPCDRVNVITESSVEEVKWNKRLCVHKDIWNKEKIDVKYFYKLRKLWIEVFVSELNNNFQYIELDENERCIIRKEGSK